VAESLADAGNVGPGHVVACNAGEAVFLAQPLLLDDVLEATLLDRVLGKLAHVHCTELIDLRCDRVLLNQRLLCECKLKRIVGREGDVETSSEVA
jgi:hypothetical protein